LAGATADDIKDNLEDLYLNHTPSTSYSTLDPTSLPLLEPLRLPARIINFVLEKFGVDFRVPTILADILEPAARILVPTYRRRLPLPRRSGRTPAKR
jgi:hypothetical protein